MSQEKRARLNEYQRNYKMAEYQARKEAGLCVICGKDKPLKSKSMCEDCLNKKNERNRKYRKERHEFLLKLGLCVKCGKEKAMPNRTTCLDCFSKEQIKYANYKRPQESIDRRNERSKVRQKELRDERRAAGLCTICGKELIDKRYLLCHLCRAKRNARQIERLAQTRKRYNLIDGVCLICGEKAVEGKKFCPEHYAEKVKAIQYAAQFKNNKNHKWGKEFGTFANPNKKMAESRSTE